MPAQLKRRLSIFLLIVLLIAGGFFAHWFFNGRFYESTDNAYVQGDITRVPSHLGARIDQVLAQDNQHADTVLFDLALDYATAKRVALARADQCGDEAYAAVVGLLRSSGR